MGCNRILPTISSDIKQYHREYNIEKSFNYPKFVKMGDGSCLRLIIRDQCYYRDGGDWSVGYDNINGQLYSVNLYSKDMDHFTGHPLVEVTKEEWLNCNGEYATSDPYEEDRYEEYFEEYYQNYLKEPSFWKL